MEDTPQYAQPARLADAALAELEALQNKAIAAFEEWENDSSNLDKLEASDEADITLGREAANALPALLARLRDSELEQEGLHKLAQKQANLLSAAVIAMRGPEPPLTMWSHHDVVELATDLVARLRHLEALPAALPTVPAAAPVAQSGWVSCADRLPDNLEDCLVLIKPINEALMHTNGATPYYKITHLNFAKTGFYVEYTEDGQHPLEEATHWQPLPTPPTPC